MVEGKKFREEFHFYFSEVVHIISVVEGREPLSIVDSTSIDPGTCPQGKVGRRHG